MRRHSAANCSRLWPMGLSPPSCFVMRKRSTTRNVLLFDTLSAPDAQWAGSDPKEVPRTMPEKLSSLSASVAARLVARKETLAVAESSAGGLISAALLSIPGASAYFMGGAVIYTQAARRAFLAVPDEAMQGIRSRAEERRVGKECRSRRSPDHLKKKR